MLANLAAWAFLNRPIRPPDWSGTLAGVSFSPYRAGQDPTAEIHPTRDEIEADLDLLRGRVRALRTYTSMDGFEVVPALARKRGLEVTAGAWLDDDRTENETEVSNLIAATRANPNVTRVIVGNEVLLRGDLEPLELARHLRRVRARVEVPVSTAEPWHVWIKHPQLAAEVDFIAIHVLPYWEGVSIESAIDFVFRRRAEVARRFPGKPVLVAEVGWPSHGRIRRGAVPSLANEARFLREFVTAAQTRGVDYFLMEAFDQPWKIPIEGGVGAYWGLFDQERRAKFPLTGPVVGVPEWPLLAGLATLLPLLPLAFAVVAFAGIAVPGRLLFAGASFAAASSFVWLGHQTFVQYHSLASALAWSALLGLFGLLLAILLAETFELVELVWKRRLARGFAPVFPGIVGRLPRVSLHVPISSEPPEMVARTLEALSRLDYPEFEVVVVDNNTPDPGVWKPVADLCTILGERFRFFHLDRCEGFKAGALNFALAQTDPAAEVVAVIDSDYLVRRDWLRNLVPYFHKAEVGLVQAPQDYRDRRESVWKTLCHWEYAGFFSLGMVHRNERNAIIQHGTMTLVRKSALAGAGGWGEWCICEDAELGLRLLARGHESVYVNYSYGRGLTPDTLSAYQRQRFRWAYGALQILKRHWRELLPWRRGGLTLGQRYHFVAGWLPWFADALNLVVTALAIIWSAGLVIAPKLFEFPLRFFISAAAVFFALKVGKTLWLYSARVPCGLAANLGAALAGLSLTHTIGKAVIAGIATRHRPFLRTPKCEDRPALVRALVAAREESVVLALLAVSAGAIALRYGVGDVEAALWLALLGVQSLPYVATLTASIVNATSSLVGERLALESVSPSYHPAHAPVGRDRLPGGM